MRTPSLFHGLRLGDRIELLQEDAKVINSKKGSIPLEYISRGADTPEAYVMVIKNSDNSLALKAHLVWRNDCRKTIASFLSDRLDDMRMTDASEARVEHFKRLFDKFHETTIYFLFDKESLLKIYLESKKLKYPPVNFILASDETPMAYRRFSPSTGSMQAKANICTL